MNSTASSERSHVVLAVLAAFTFFLMLLLLAPLYRMGLWLEQANEGWNAVHASNAFRLSLYPARGHFFVNNYPPLWFYLTGALSGIFGDPIFPGRVVAFLAFVATGFGIYAILRQLGATRVAGFLGVLSFSAIMAGLLDMYVGLSEPQMLAHALVTNGTAILIASKTRRGVIAAAFVITTGLFVKHIVVALPLASAFWLFRFRREFFWRWVGACAALGVVSAALLLAIYGWNFVDNIFFPRSFELDTFRTSLGLISKVSVPLVAFCVVAWQRRRIADEGIAFAGAAIAAGFATHLVFGSALGVSINSIFDLLIASSIGLGIAWDRLIVGDNGRESNFWRITIVALLALRIAVGLDYNKNAVLPVFDRDARALLLEQSSKMVELRDTLKLTKGPVACETLSVCVWGGHASEVDLWKLRHERTVGPYLDTKMLLTQISQGDFGAIVSFGAVASAADDYFLVGLFEALKHSYSVPKLYGRSSLYLQKAIADKN